MRWPKPHKADHAAPISADTSFVMTKYLDLAYAGVSKTQTLDFYLPNNGSGPFPVLFCVHGGGFAFGDSRGGELAIALKGQTHNSAESFESRYMGAVITSIPDKIKETNPETWIDAKDPPFLIAHGTADQNIPTQQSVGFANKLAAALGADKVQLVVIPGAVHGGAAFEIESNMKTLLGDRVIPATRVSRRIPGGIHVRLTHQGVPHPPSRQSLVGGQCLPASPDHREGQLRVVEDHALAAEA